MSLVQAKETGALQVGGTKCTQGPEEEVKAEQAWNSCSLEMQDEVRELGQGNRGSRASSSSEYLAFFFYSKCKWEAMLGH